MSSTDRGTSRGAHRVAKRGVEKALQPVPGTEDPLAEAPRIERMHVGRGYSSRVRPIMAPAAQAAAGAAGPALLSPLRALLAVPLESRLNLEKVIFGFFTIFACTLNFGFFLGDMDRPDMHHPSELFAAIIVNLIALVAHLANLVSVTLLIGGKDADSWIGDHTPRNGQMLTA